MSTLWLWLNPVTNQFHISSTCQKNQFRRLLHQLTTSLVCSFSSSHFPSLVSSPPFLSIYPTYLRKCVVKQNYIVRAEIQDPTGKHNMAEYPSNIFKVRKKQKSILTFVMYIFSTEYVKGAAPLSPGASSSSSAAKPAMDSIKPFEFSKPLDLAIRTNKAKYLYNEQVQVEIQSPMVPCDGTSFPPFPPVPFSPFPFIWKRATALLNWYFPITLHLPCYFFRC